MYRDYRQTAVFRVLTVVIIRFGCGVFYTGGFCWLIFMYFLVDKIEWELFLCGQAVGRFFIVESGRFDGTGCFGHGCFPTAFVRYCADLVFAPDV